MWKGWIIDKSLKDLDILTKLKIIKVVVGENTEGYRKRVWKLYTVEAGEKEIDDIVKPGPKTKRSGRLLLNTDLKWLKLIQKGV